MVGGLGRRQDSRGGTAKPRGALSQAESHLTLPGSTKHLTRGVGGWGWAWWRQMAVADDRRVQGWDRWRPLARRYGGGGWGCPGMEVRGQQDSGKTAPGLGCSSYLLRLFPGTSWSNTVMIFTASSFHWVLHMLPVPLFKPQVYVEVTCWQLLSLLCVSPEGFPAMEARVGQARSGKLTPSRVTLNKEGSELVDKSSSFRSPESGTILNSQACSSLRLQQNGLKLSMGKTCLSL